MTVQIVHNTDPTFHLPSEGLGFACEQRTFGPRRTVVVFADSDGTVATIAHTGRTDPAEHAAVRCLDQAGERGQMAVVYSDEPVRDGEPDRALIERWVVTGRAFADAGVWLVDWIVCDDLRYRSLRISIEGDDEWWPAA